MKKNLIIAISILVTLGVHAQPPGGGRPPGGGDGPPPGRGMPNHFSSTEDKLVLEHFPDIPDLTLQQREKVGSILSKEKENIDKQVKKKQEIERTITPETSEKDLKKKRQKIEKIDKKVNDILSKSNSKIKKELSEEQYCVFLEKRKEFKFRRHPQRQDMMPAHQNNDNNDERPPFPPQGQDGDEFF